MSSQDEQLMPQFNQAYKSLVNSGTDAQPVEFISQQTGDGVILQAAAAKSSRLFFIDNLRVFLIILVVMFHLAITYGAAGSWYYRDPTKDTLTSVLLTILTATDQAFFMGLLFLISAYFTPGSYDRKGAGPFLRDRLLSPLRIREVGAPIIIRDTAGVGEVIRSSSGIYTMLEG